MINPTALFRGLQPTRFSAILQFCRRGAPIKATDAKRIPPSRPSFPIFSDSRGSLYLRVNSARSIRGREPAKGQGRGVGRGGRAAAASSGYLEFEAGGRVRLAPSQTDLPN